tara:strand:+ start:870 stop:1433 length:564 start_codon:yes stop_codon:yes gene_type:complete
MKKPLMIALAAGTAMAGLAAGVAVHAQSGAERPAMTREAAEQRATEMFARMDANSDGMLNEADREARQRQLFDQMDADSNGSITLEEFNAARETFKEMRSERREARGERFAGRGGHGRRGGGERMLTQADTDGDGSISQAELTAAMLARFDAADTNGDGEISSDERRGPGKRGPGAGRMAPPAAQES